MINMLKNFWKEEEGQDLIEYALLLTLVLLVSAGTLVTLGGQVDAKFKLVSGQFS